MTSEHQPRALRRGLCHGAESASARSLTGSSRATVPTTTASSAKAQAVTHPATQLAAGKDADVDPVIDHADLSGRKSFGDEVLLQLG